MNPWIDGLQTAYNVNSQGNISLEFEFNSVKKGKRLLTSSCVTSSAGIKMTLCE